MAGFSPEPVCAVCSATLLLADFVNFSQLISPTFFSWLGTDSLEGRGQVLVVECSVARYGFPVGKSRSGLPYFCAVQAFPRLLHAHRGGGGGGGITSCLRAEMAAL